MNRTLRSIAALVMGAAVFAVPATADADKPTKGGCPSHTWVVNGPAEWLTATIAGIDAEGSNIDEQAELFGFGTDVDAFKDWIIEGVFGDGLVGGTLAADVNGDGLVCRATNTPSGYPEFYFQVQDNKHHAKFA